MAVRFPPSAFSRLTYMDQAALSRKLHRRHGLELEPGFWRWERRALRSYRANRPLWSRPSREPESKAKLTRSDCREVAAPGAR